MQNHKLPISVVFPKRAKNAELRNRARCPGCATMVKWSDGEDGDEVLATNCKFFCEKEDGKKWIDDPLCYAKNFLVEVKLTKKPQTKKKKSYYKNKKKKAKSGKNYS